MIVCVDWLGMHFHNLPHALPLYTKNLPLFPSSLTIAILYRTDCNGFGKNYSFCCRPLLFSCRYTKQSTIVYNMQNHNISWSLNIITILLYIFRHFFMYLMCLPLPVKRISRFLRQSPYFLRVYSRFYTVITRQLCIFFIYYIQNSYCVLFTVFCSLVTTACAQSLRWTREGHCRFLC